MQIVRWTIPIAAIFVLAGAMPCVAQVLEKPPLIFSPNAVPNAESIIRAAEAGHPRSQTILGYMYETGQGVPQDYKRAAKWYARAAEQGHFTAQYLLGFLFDKGFGVPRDHIEAHKWLNLAAGAAPPRSRDVYARMRNAVASKLTALEIREAQWRARVWQPVPER